MDPYLSNILSEFGINAPYKIEPYGQGLINNTWVIEDPISGKYILQKLNQNIFRNPESISQNIRVLSNYFKKTHPDYLFTSPISSLHGNDLVRDITGSCYRLFDFIPESCTASIVESPELAYKAAKAFGEFTKLLNNIDLSQIRITIPQFHNLSYRYEEFFWALNRANETRKELAKNEIKFLAENRSIALEYEIIKRETDFKLRVTHHDTKISNVLLDENKEVICLIDLDTVMPGYFISDFGDILRTYLSPVSEEETSFNLIHIRHEYLEAVLSGYLSEMDPILNPLEKKHLLYSGKFMIYMQAMRFLTDYLNGSPYYKSKYPEHNLNRAKNQIYLFKELIKAKEYFNNYHLGQR